MNVTTSGCCRICGCTDDRACEGGCYWVADDICSTCAPCLNIPQELRELNRWVAWDVVKKKPIDPHMGGWASRLEPNSLGSFEEALSFTNREGLTCIALLLPSDIYAVDIDNCVVSDEMTEHAFEIVHLMQGYTEISPSGKGVHIICRGQLPINYPKHMGFIDLFGEGRFIAFSGRQILEKYNLSDDMERKLAFLHPAHKRTTLL